VAKVETAAKQREQSLARRVDELKQQLENAEKQLTRAREERDSAQRLCAEEVSRAREEAEARELRANLEKEQIAKRLEETRTQLEHLLAAAASSASSSASSAASPSPSPSPSPSLATAPIMTAPGIRCKLDGNCMSADTITFRWETEGLPLSTADWIGLFIHNRQYSNKYSKYLCTKGQPTGEGRFTGLLPGTYDLRFFLAGTPRETARTGPILVGTGVELHATFEAKPGCKREVHVSWDGQAAMSTANDWVGLFHASTLSNKRYIAYQYVTGFTSLVFAAPREPGEYSVRYFRAGSGYCFSGCMTVTVPNDDKLEVVPSDGSTKPGTVRVRVRWQCYSAESARGDWIGVFESAEPTAARLGYAYTSSGRAPEGDHGVVDVDVNTPSNTPTETLPVWEIRFFATSLPKDKQPHLRIPYSPKAN